MCMRRLIEEGADLNALTNEGKSPVKLAEEMKYSLVPTNVHSKIHDQVDIMRTSGIFYNQLDTEAGFQY